MSDFDEPRSFDEFDDEPSIEFPPYDTERTIWSQLPPLSYSSIATWGRLLSGTMLSIGGICAGAYVLKNVERPTGWALTSLSVGAAGAYITGLSLRKLCCSDNREGVYDLEHGTALDYEEAYYAANPDSRTRVLARFDAFSRGNSDTSPPFTVNQFSYSLPRASLSDVSSDIFNLNLGNYISRSTDLSFRPSDKEKKKVKKCLRREWSSAPTILHKQEDYSISLNYRMNLKKNIGEVEEQEYEQEVIEIGTPEGNLKKDHEVVNIGTSSSEESLL